MTIPNPPEELQVVPDVSLDQKKKEEAEAAIVDRKPFVFIPDSNPERKPSVAVSYTCIA